MFFLFLFLPVLEHLALDQVLSETPHEHGSINQSGHTRDFCNPGTAFHRPISSQGHKRPMDRQLDAPDFICHGLLPRSSRHKPLDGWCLSRVPQISQTWHSCWVDCIALLLLHKLFEAQSVSLGHSSPTFRQAA